MNLIVQPFVDKILSRDLIWTNFKYFLSFYGSLEKIKTAL